MAAELPFAAAEPASSPLTALFAECRDCDAIECFPSTAGLPAGWRIVGDERARDGKAVLCPDCRGHADNDNAGEPPATPAFVHCGFRLTHSLHLVAGFATLRIHGGRRSRAGVPDSPATFLADRAGIRELINELEAIDGQLATGS